MFFLTQEEELPTRRDNLVLFFYVSDMSFYSKLFHLLDQLESQYAFLSFYAIDAACFEGLCKRFGVESVPHLLFFQAGYEKARLSQTVHTRNFSQFFADICIS